MGSGNSKAKALQSSPRKTCKETDSDTNASKPPLPMEKAKQESGNRTTDVQSATRKKEDDKTSVQRPPLPTTTAKQRQGNRTTGVQQSNEATLLRKTEEAIKSVKRTMAEVDNIHKQKTRMNMRRLSTDTEVSPAIMGDMSYECPSLSKVVRIFTSSTFTDTNNERNTLMEKAYPELKRRCHNLGYDFQVVDMRWGVRDEANDDHSTADLCLRELQLCQELSTGPFFVTLLSHKYGYRSLPRCIDGDEFEHLLSHIPEGNDKDKLQKWYNKDANAIPPVYLLSKISKFYPNYLSLDKVKKDEAKGSWWNESLSMKFALESAAIQNLNEISAQKYIISVTEKEIQEGIIQTETAKHTALWFKRNIIDIDSQEPSQRLSRYKECYRDDYRTIQSEELIEKLKDEIIPPKIPKENIKSYNIKWTDEGVNPRDQHHKQYLQQLNDDFVTSVYQMVRKAINAKDKSNVVNKMLYQECVSHLRFGQEKCKLFTGSEKQLQAIKDHILDASRQHQTVSQAPIIIVGGSGSGKTSLLAKIAKEIPEWRQNTEPVVVTRFIGTTPVSSHIEDVLFYLIQQINIIYGYAINTTKDTRNLNEDFHFALRHARPSRPLYIVLDAMDQLSNTNMAKDLSWLPSRLPPCVTLILSILEEDVNRFLPQLQIRFGNRLEIVKVADLEQQDMQKILDFLLDKYKRKLTSPQKQIVLKTVQQCKIPLFLKLVFDQARTWASFCSEDEIKLETTVLATIETLFNRLEAKYGKKYVSRSLGYITISRSGLGESELEDVLACEDDVLDEIFQYWTPPSRRLPPLLLVRLRTDLQEYLVDRGTDDTLVMYWYHRQFKEAARKRYCDSSVAKDLHLGLAHFFIGKWVNGKTYTDKNGKEILSDRHVSPQPLKYDQVFNQRKLNNQAYHCILSGDAHIAKQECLCNFQYLDTKIQCCTVSSVMEDMYLARKEFPRDQAIHKINKTLELSNDALVYDQKQLAPQLKSRLSKENDPYLANLLKECQESDSDMLECDVCLFSKPKGQLTHCLTEHGDKIESIAINQKGNRLVTCDQSEDCHSVKLWDTSDGRMLSSYNNLGKYPSTVYFVSKDEIIFIEFIEYILGIKESGEIVYKVPLKEPGLIGFTGDGFTYFVHFFNKYADVYNSVNGQLVTSLQQDFTQWDCPMGPIASSSHFVLVTDQSSTHVSRFTEKEMKLSSFSQLYSEEETNPHQLEELKVDALAISPDETCFAHRAAFDQDIVIRKMKDFTVLKKIKGSMNEDVGNMQFSPSGKRLIFCNQQQLCIADLASNRHTTACSHFSNVKAVVTKEEKLLYTISEDCSLRFWDTTLEDDDIHQEVAVIRNKIISYVPLSNPRYVLVVTKKEDYGLNGTIYLYDIIQKKIITSVDVMDNIPHKVFALDEKRVALVNINKKIKVLNVQKMEIELGFHGLCESPSAKAILLADKKRCILMSKGRKSLKIIGTNTGKTTQLLKPLENVSSSFPHMEREFYTDGKFWAVASLQGSGPIILFDLKNGKSKHKLIETKDPDDMYTFIFSSDGKYIGMRGETKLQRRDERCSHGNSVLVIEAATNKRIGRCDISKSSKVINGTEHQETLTFHNLDQQRFLTVHEGHIVAIWAWQTAQMLQYLGPFRGEINICISPRSSIFLVHGWATKDNTLSVFDKKQCQLIASIRPDYLIKNCQILDHDLGFITHYVHGDLSYIAFLTLTRKEKMCAPVPSEDIKLDNKRGELWIVDDVKDLETASSDLDTDTEGEFEDELFEDYPD